MKFRYFITAACATIALLASAQTPSDPMYMVLTMRNGDLKAVNIDEVSQLTFPDGNMIVSKKDASTETIKLTELSNMEFSHTETGALKAILKGSPLAFNAAASALALDGVDGKVLFIYNAGGALMLRHVTNSGVVSLDLSALAPGTYIATYNGKSFKFVK